MKQNQKKQIKKNIFLIKLLHPSCMFCKSNPAQQEGTKVTLSERYLNKVSVRIGIDLKTLVTDCSLTRSIQTWVLCWFF